MSESASPFTMLGGEGVVCEGDVCIVPGTGQDAATAAE